MSEPVMLGALRAALRRASVPVARIWRDDYHPQATEPVETRLQPPTGLFGNNDYEAHFYPTILRWVLDDGRAGSMMLNPIIVKVGARWREDSLAQGREFFARITAHYARPGKGLEQPEPPNV